MVGNRLSLRRYFIIFDFLFMYKMGMASSILRLREKGTGRIYGECEGDDFYYQLMGIIRYFQYYIGFEMWYSTNIQRQHSTSIIIDKQQQTYLMFNPQRKSKISDILMQERAYKLHLSKKNKIQHSPKPRRYQSESQQEHYLSKLQRSKREVKQRLSADLHRQNLRLMNKLIETDRQKFMLNPQKKKHNVKHSNSYFNNRREKKRIHQQNYTLVMRIDEKPTGIPSLEELERQFKQSKKYANNCRKLPSILKHEERFKKNLSQPQIETSRARSTKLK